MSSLLFFLSFFTLPGRQDMMCAYVQSFPMIEMVHVAEGGDGFRTQLLNSLCKTKPSLCIVTVFSSSVSLKWTAGDCSP